MRYLIGKVGAVDTASLLSSVIKGGNEAVARFLIDDGADVNLATPSGQKLLDVAVGNWRLPVARVLVEMGTDINSRSIKGKTPLHFAVESFPRLSFAEMIDFVPTTDTGVVKFLVEVGANVNAVDEDGDTPLTLAIKKGWRWRSIYLVENGVDVNARDASGRTPLMVAVTKQYRDAALFLYEKGADLNAKDDKGRTPLMIVVGEGRKRSQEIPRFFKASYVYQQSGRASSGVGEMVRGKLSKEIQLPGYTEDDEFIVCMDPDGYGTGYMDEVVNESLKRKLSSGKEMVMHESLNWKLSSEKEMVMLLLEHGADVNVKDDLGATPLHLAVMDGSISLVKVLVEIGASLNDKDHDGNSPLDIAYLSARSTTSPSLHESIIELLEDNRALRGEDLR